MTNPIVTPDWTDQYSDWQGTWPELVDTANQILANQFHNAKPITERLARHYQAKGAVSRGNKLGRAAIFGVRDLMSLVSTKKLVTEGFPLEYASTLVSNAPATQVAQALTPSGAKATSVVANMMSQLGGALLPDVPRAFSAQASLSAASSVTSDPPLWEPSVTTPMRTISQTLFPPQPALSPVPWMQLTLDEAALKKASIAERTQAAHALLGLASRLTAPTGDQ
jgi:hypothetical protein